MRAVPADWPQFAIKVFRQKRSEVLASLTRANQHVGIARRPLKQL